VLGAARVFVEALRRAGRDLSRERAIEALEGLHEFRTGYTPPITFGPERRVGARGANIVAIDPASGRVTPVGGWQAIDPNDPHPRRGD
jgi:hypothetical protein